MTSKPRILLVEDERHLAFTIGLNLRAEGLEVIQAQNGHEALDAYQQKRPFVGIILDIMIPEPDGFEVARAIRSLDKETGILMLTARASDADRLHGLTLGADDYLTKPFHLPELLARVRRMVERAQLLEQHYKDCEKNGDLKLNTETLTLTIRGQTKALTVLEAELLATFLRSPERVLSRNYLLRQVWRMSGEITTRTVDNFIMRLRRLIEIDPTQPRYLTSVRGRGYRFTPHSTETP